MGCDIHASIEYRPDWRRPGEPLYLWAVIESLPRNYNVFCAMAAGVRDYGRGIEPVAKPRGVPDDCDADTRRAADDPEWHSHSWLSADEFAEALRRAEAEHPEYMALLAAVRALGPGARVVFWFDN